MHTSRPSRALLTAAGTGLAVLIAFGPAPNLSGQRETRERHAYITALGDRDTPVLDLTATEVVVREDGAVREIVKVERATAPMQIALLVDDSQVAQPLVKELRQALVGFVEAIATQSPDTEMSLMTFGERPTRVMDFTTSASLVGRAADKIFHRTGAGAYFLEALTDTAKAVKKKEATRPVVVAFVIDEGPEFSNLTWRTVSDALKGAKIALWTIVLQGRSAGGQSNEQRERASVLTDVAEASGGSSKMILDRLALAQAYAGVAARLTSQLDVTYVRPERMIPPKAIEISVKRPGIKVQASRWAGQ